MAAEKPRRCEGWEALSGVERSRMYPCTIHGAQTSALLASVRVWSMVGLEAISCLVWSLWDLRVEYLIKMGHELRFGLVEPIIV